MKVLIQRLEARLQRLPSFTITAMGLGWVLALGALDCFTPDAASLTLFYLFAVIFTGWGAGKGPAGLVAAVAALSMLTVQWYWHREIPQPGWLLLWNAATRFLAFSVVGCLAAEVARLARHLSQLVEERTAQWKTEVAEHQSTAARLAETLARFEQVINNITEAFWLSDVSKRQMVYISPGYERLWGRTCAELYREPLSWLAAVHPADREAVSRSAHADQSTGGYDIEYRIIRPDGTIRWIRDRGFPVRNAQGEVYRIAGLADDITDRKRAREELQTRAAILEGMTEGVVVTDEQGRIVQMNPAAERMWGYQLEEMLGQPADSISVLPEPEKAAVMQEVLAALRTTGSWHGKFTNRHKSGRLVYCDAFLSRVEVAGRTLYVALQQDVSESRRTQEQLQMQARVLESMGEAVLMVDEQGTILLSNPALDAEVGYARGDLIGRPLETLSARSPEEFQRMFACFLDQVKTRGFLRDERLVRRKDGSVFEIECRSSGFTLDGRFFMVLVGQDITERNRAQLALKQSEESLRVFLNAVPQPALLLDREGVILLANPAASVGMDRSPPELPGRNIFDITPPGMLPDWKNSFDRILQTRKPARFEEEHQGRHYIIFFNPVLDAVGNVSRVAIFALDITERKQSETALARKEELYRTLFELSPDGIVAGDAGGTILDANQALCQAFGYAREELLGRNVRGFAPLEQQPKVEAHLATLRAGRSLQSELWGLRQDGDRRLMALHATPLMLPDGQPGSLAVIRDITETKRASLIRQAFLTLATHLSEVDSPLAAGRAMVTAADQLWQWDAAVLQLYSAERDCLESVLLIDTLDGQRREVSSAGTDSSPLPRMRQIIENGAELILRTPAELQSADLVAFGDAQRRSASLMYAPLRRKDQTIGILSIQSYAFNTFTPEDLRTLEALADLCGGALERIRAEQALREAHDQLERRVQERTTALQAANQALNQAHAQLEQRVRERTAELHAANTALRQSEERYRSLVNNLNVGIYRNTPDAEGLLLQVNPALARILGYDSADEIRNVRIVDTYQDPGQRAALLAELLRAGSVRNYELLLRKRDGTPICASVNVTVHRNARGEVDWLDGVLEDITQQKRIQEALSASEERYRALAESSPDAILIFDRDLKVQYANPAAAAIWRRPVERLLAETTAALFPSETGPCLEALAQDVFGTGQPARAIEAAPFPAGDQWLEVRFVPLRDARGAATAMMGLCRDISKRKQADILLQAQRDLGAGFSLTSDLDVALRHLLDIILRLGAVDSGGVYLLNEASGEMTLAVHRGGSPAFIKAVSSWTPNSPQMQLLREGQPVFCLYQDLPISHTAPRRSEGLRASAFIPLSHNGRIIGALTLASKVADEIPRQTQIVIEAIAAQAAGAIARIKAETDRQRLEGQILEISDRQQARIGQDIHDGLCQHLVSLAFDANSLHRALAGKHRGPASKARRIALYLDHAITEARQLSRGLFPVQLGTEGLPHALEDLASTTGRRFKIQCHFSPPKSVIAADAVLATHLYRIAQEAVTNAVKHSQARRISIHLDLHAGRLELRIEDDGRGLSAPQPGAGGGMGLHIMDYRARAIGGTFRIGASRLGGTLVSCCAPVGSGGQSPA